MQTILTSSRFESLRSALTDFLPVDVGKHDVEHDHVRMVFLDHHAGVEAVVGHADLEATVRFEDVPNQLDQFLVVIHDQRLAFAAFEGVGRNAVFLHELIEDVAGNTPKTRSGDSEPFELSGIKAADNGLLADLTDFGCFARRKDRFHEARPIPSILSTYVVSRR